MVLRGSPLGTVISQHSSLNGLSLHSSVPLQQAQGSRAAHPARKRPRPRSEEHPPTVVMSPTRPTEPAPMGGLLQRLEMLQVSPGCARRRRTAVRRSGEAGGAAGLHRSRSFLHDSSLRPVQKGKSRCEPETLLKPSKLSKLVAPGSHRDEELLKHVKVVSARPPTRNTPADSNNKDSTNGLVWGSRVKIKAQSASSSSLSSLREPEGQQQQRPANNDDVAFANAPSIGSTSLSQSLQDFSEELRTISLNDDQSAVKKRPKRKKKRRSRTRETACHSEDGSGACSANHCSDRSNSTCAQQARKEYLYNDISVNDLAGYLEDSMVFPKKMSYMAEMMYT